MRYMENNGKNLKCRLMPELSQRNGLLMYNMGLDQKDQQLQVSWSFLKWYLKLWTEDVQ